MSHFSVIVATEEYPTEQVLVRELQPFHEFECTGVDDQYVRDIDETERVRADYEAATTSRLRDGGGGLHDPWDDRFYRDPTPKEKEKIGPLAGTGGGNGLSWASKDWGDGLGYRTKVQFVPDGWEEVEVARKEVQSFAEYVGDWHGKELIPHGHQIDIRGEHQFGYAILDQAGEVVKVVDRTNPDKKWDWWQVGGRYSGKFIPKAAGKPNRATVISGGGQSRYRVANPPVGVDVIRVGDLDRATMRAIRINERRAFLDKTLTKCGIPHGEADELFRQKRDAHAEWMTMEEPRPRGREYGDWCHQSGFPLAGVLNAKCWGSPDVPAGMTVAEWVNAAPCLTAFAFLMGGKWSENGEMGWWGAVHNEKDQKSWEAELQSLVDSVPEDWHLTVVDCHI